MFMYNYCKRKWMYCLFRDRGGIWGTLKGVRKVDQNLASLFLKIPAEMGQILVCVF